MVCEFPYQSINYLTPHSYAENVLILSNRTSFLSDSKVKALFILHNNFHFAMKFSIITFSILIFFPSLCSYFI